MIYAITAFGLALVLAAWDATRRFIADRKQAREFERDVAYELLQDLKQHGEELSSLRAHLVEKQERTDKALGNFLTQVRELVRFSEDKAHAAQVKSLNKALEGRRG